MRHFLLTIALVCCVSSFADAAERLSVVRVNVTTQGWDFLRPWGKRQPVTRRAMGAVIAGPRVLVAGELVANATYIEFETPEGGKKVPATVEAVDYEANLAVLKTDDADFLKDLPPLEVAESAIGDTLSIWQLENNGRLLVTKGPMTTAEMAPYPVDGIFLIYRATMQLQGRDSSFTLPVVNGGKLTGILQSYEAQSTNANIIPAPVIQHFLRDIADGKNDGFPRAGYAFSPTRDPAFRRFAKIPADIAGGIYITEVLKDGPAGKGGLQKGDILTAVDGFAVDQDGNYDDPTYGKISIGHLLCTRHFVGEEVKMHILREGQPQVLGVQLTHRAPQENISDPYIIDRAPRFTIVGGFIFQELSRQYLKDFGQDWARRAPERLVYLDRYQNEVIAGGQKKLVFLSRVLPTPATVGFEELSNIVVEKINDVPLLSLEDIAKALEKPINGFHKIQFAEEPGTIYLDAEQATKLAPLVQRQYRLPTLQRLE